MGHFYYFENQNWAAQNLQLQPPGHRLDMASVD